MVGWDFGGLEKVVFILSVRLRLRGDSGGVGVDSFWGGKEEIGLGED